MKGVSIPGIALGIVHGNEIVHMQGAGDADSSGPPMTPQTPFHVGSLGKSFTALAVMQLVEAGKIERKGLKVLWWPTLLPSGSSRFETLYSAMKSGSFTGKIFLPKRPNTSSAAVRNSASRLPASSSKTLKSWSSMRQPVVLTAKAKPFISRHHSGFRRGSVGGTRDARRVVGGWGMVCRPVQHAIQTSCRRLTPGWLKSFKHISNPLIFGL